MAHYTSHFLPAPAPVLSLQFGKSNGASMPAPGGGGGDADPASDDEVYFSDDEAEAHYLRQAKAKRKGPPGQGQGEAGHAPAAGGPHTRSGPGQHGEGPGVRPARKARPAANGEWQAGRRAGRAGWAGCGGRNASRCTPWDQPPGDVRFLHGHAPQLRRQSIIGPACVSAKALVRHTGG